MDKFTRRGRSWLRDSQGRDLFVKLANDGDQVVGAFRMLLKFYVPAERSMKVIAGGAGTVI
jgi:hypothetical protein